MSAPMAKVLEIQGDADSDNVRVQIPAAALGGVAPGTELGANLLPTGFGGALLIVGPAGPGVPYAFGVEELEGDEDTASQWLVVPKTVLGVEGEAGMELPYFQAGTLVIISLSGAA